MEKLKLTRILLLEQLQLTTALLELLHAPNEGPPDESLLFSGTAVSGKEPSSAWSFMFKDVSGMSGHDVFFYT